MDVYARRLSGLKDKLLCSFKLAMDMVEAGVREFVYDSDGPALLKQEVVGFSVDRYQSVRGHDCICSRPVPIHTF